MKNLILCIISLLLLCSIACQTGPIQQTKNYTQYYPKSSEDATILLNLQSNIQKTVFTIDGKKIAVGRRVKALINEGQHTVVASPKGYKSKEEFIQPPYMPDSRLSFTFLLEDKLPETQENNAQSVVQHKPDKKPESHTADPTKPSDEPRYWAVIIGISKYKYAGQNSLSNLAFADDDARAFNQVLKNFGWKESHIKLLVNEEATKRNISIALEAWLTKAKLDDQIVLFWAGHGFPDPIDSEKVYFACYDTRLAIPVTGYRMDRVRSILEERNSKNVIVFADTCHAGKLITRGDRGISIMPQLETMQKNKNIPKGWVFMVGADTDREAIEHTSWTNGAFTHALLKGLGGEADGFQSAGPHDGVVTLGELKEYMKTFMPNETQQVLGVAKHPLITTSTGNPDIWNLTLQVPEKKAN